MAENQMRIKYYDYLRVFATFFIVIIHVSSRVWEKVEIGTYNWLIISSFLGLARWAVPMFVLISGALFLSSGKPFSKILKTNFIRIITAFLFWSFIYAIEDYFGGEGLVKSISHFIKGRFHLWFIFMILGLYLLIPFLRVITKNEKLTEYFIILSIIFAVIVPQIVSVSVLFVPAFASLLDYVVYNSFLFFPLGYSGYFVLGYYLSKKQLSKNLRIIIYVLGVLSLIATIVATLVITVFLNEKTEIFYNYLTLNVFLAVVAIFVFAQNHSFSDNSNVYRVVKAVSKCCFGVYLSHILVIDILCNIFNFNALSFNPVFAVPVISIAVFVVSFICIFLIGKIPRINKYII